MKPKMRQQPQPCEIAPPRRDEVREEVQAEIRNFLQALDSYPARVAQEPGVSFHQHLCSLVAATRMDGNSRDLRTNRL
jgi:hypothetical protein